MKIGDEVYIHGYIDEIRKDTIIIKNDGGYFGTVECEVTDIEMSDTNEVLEKIRAEIEHLNYLSIEDGSDGYDKYVDQYDVLQIIDKYTKGESE